MIVGIEIKNGSCDPDYAPFKGGLSFLIYKFYVRKFVRA